MAFKLEVTFNVPVRIIGDLEQFTPINNQIIIVCSPFSTQEGGIDFSDATNQIQINGVNTYNATYNIQGRTFQNVIVFNPSVVEEENGKLKCSFPTGLNSIIKYFDEILYFYDESKTAQKIIRKNVPSNLSKSTKSSIGQSDKTLTKSISDPNDPNENIVVAEEEFDFEIKSGSINASGTEITYSFTESRSLTFKDGNGNTVSDNLADINGLLALTFTNSDLYYDDNTSTIPSTFDAAAAAAGSMSVNTSNQTITLDLSNTSGKLVGNSVPTNFGIQPSTLQGSITGEDQFDLSLLISEDYTFTNNIKNPTIKAVINPRDSLDGYIALELYETTDANAPKITTLNPNYVNNDGTLRHGAGPNATLTQTAHPVANSFAVTALEDGANPYTGLQNIAFAFDQNTNIEESQNTPTSNLIVKERSATGDIIGLRLDRFPRYGINYQVTYSHKVNLTSGIFNSDGNAVITPVTMDINNNLQEVTGTVGKFKVHYPPQKPTTWNTPSGSFNGNDIPYQDYSAYYYVDITFKRGNTPALITAKYNWNPELFQTQAGHNIHHGLILTKDNTTSQNGKVDEEITRTTIRYNNDDVVYLDSTSFGNKLRIELPVAIGDGSNKYPYDTDSTFPRLTSKNFADLDSKSQLDLIDREELDNGQSQQTPSYYYINVMDSLGNVVSPIKNEVLQTDNDWGKDSDGNSPEIEKAEYLAEWDGNNTVWLKKVVMTFKQDLKEMTQSDINNLFNPDANNITISTSGPTNILSALNVDIDQQSNTATIQIRSNDYNEITYSNVSTISAEYTQPTTAATDTNTIHNWLGFKIASFNETLVLASNMSSLFPTISNISFGNISNQGSPATSFSGDLTWSLSSGSPNGLTYKIEYSTSSDFSSGVVSVVANQGHITNNPTQDQTKSITGLSFNTNYYFRVTPTNFDEGSPVSTTTAFSQVGPATQLLNFSVGDTAGPAVVASWPKPLNASQYKLEYRAYDYNNSNFPGTWQHITGFSEFTETTSTNPTTVSYTFDDNTTELDGNTQYQLRASYSTTVTAPYTFGPVSSVDAIVTFPDEDYTITVENSSDDANLAYNSLKVSWTPETTDAIVNNQDMPLSYEIQIDTSSSFANFTPHTTGIQLINGVNEKEITQLDASTTYYIRVRSKNYSVTGFTGGNDQYSNYIPSSTGQFKSTNLPPIPTPSSFSLSLDITSNAHKIKAEWDEPTVLDYYEYKLEVSTTSSYGNDIIGTITSGFSVDANKVNITIDDNDLTGTETFSGNTTYYLRASIRQSADGTTYGNYGNTSGDNILTRPPKVTGLSSSTPELYSGTSVVLSWNLISPTLANVGNNGYNVEQYDDSTSTWNQIGSTGVGIDQLTVTGLTSETSYQFRVYATNAGGDGEESDTLNVTTPDVTAPLYTAGSWFKSTDGSNFTGVNSATFIKGGEYVKYTFQSDDSDVLLSGNAVLKASDDSGSSFDTVETTNTLNTGDNAGDYYVQFQIAESEDENGYLRISFRLKDSAGNETALIEETKTNFTLDTTVPSLNSGSANWYYSTDSGTSYTELNGDGGSQILAPGDKIKAYIYPTDTGGSDMQDITVTCPSVTLGGGTINNSGTGATGNPSVTYVTDDGEGDAAFELVYTIPPLNTSDANGSFGFNVNIEDEAENLVSTTNMTPPTTGVTITVDTVAPTVSSFTTTTATGSYKEGENIVITANTSEDIQSGNTITVTLDTTDTVLLTAASSGTTLVGTYTVGVGDTSSGLTVSSFTIGTVADTAGNAMTSTNLPAASSIFGSKTIVIDTTVPTPQSAVVPASGDRVIITFNEELFLGTNGSFDGFSVNVSGLGSGGSTNQSIAKDTTDPKKIIISGPQIWSSTYTTAVTVSYAQPTTEANKLRDVAGNLLANFNIQTPTDITNNSSQVPDTTSPTMTITASEGTDPFTSNDATLSLTFTSSEATTDFEVGDISVSNGTLTNFSGSGASYTATFTPTGDGACTIDVDANKFTDAAGNDNTAATQFNWTYNSSAPSMTIASTTSGVTDGSTTNDSSIALTFTSSEATSNFIVGDITVSNGTLSNFSGSGTSYTATFTPTTQGACTIDVSANKFTDAFGNNNTAATQFNWTYDATGPTMTITASEGTDPFTSNDATLSLTFTSSEATSNFTVGDITVSNGTLSNFSGSGTSYTATFTPTGSGACTIDVDANKFTDAPGNNNTAATQFNWTYAPPTDSTGPTITNLIYSKDSGDGTWDDANKAIKFNPTDSSITLKLQATITDTTNDGSSGTISSVSINNGWTQETSSPSGTTYSWTQTFSHSGLGTGNSSPITGPTITATDGSSNSSTANAVNFAKIEYEYEDPGVNNSSFTINLLSGTDAKPGNVNFIVEYELNGNFTIRRDVDLVFEFSKDNTFDPNSVVNSLSTDTNNKIANDDWTNDKYAIQSYDTNLNKSNGYTDLGIGPGEKYVRLKIIYNDGTSSTSLTHLFVINGPNSIIGDTNNFQSSHGSLVRADKPWYCVLDVSGNDNNYWETEFDTNYFILEKHNNIVKQDPATYDVINGYYDSTGNEIGVKFKLPQYRFVPDISYNREIISSSPTGNETWGVYNNSTAIGASTTTTNWMYRDDVRRKIGILEPDVKGYYIRGKDKNSGNNNDYDIILQPNEYGTWEDVSPTQTASGASTLYGKSVDISRDGKFVIVGEPEKVNGLTGNDAGYGVAHVYEVSSNGSLTAKGSEIKYSSSSRFGTAVAINGDGSRIAVSDPGEETSTTHQGYILTYTFDPNVNDWTSESLNSSANGGGAYKIEGGETGTGTNGLYAKAGDKFGWCMEMSEDGKTIIVGAPGTESNTDTSKGYINVFQYIPPASLGPTQTPGGGVGVPQTIRFGLLDYIEGENSTDRFGFSVDMVKFQPEYIAVGAPGDQSVSVFRGELDTNTNIYSFKRRCSPNGSEGGGDKTIGGTQSGDIDVGYSIKIVNSWTTGNGTGEGDVTTIDFGYSLGYTKDENGIHTLVVGAPEEIYQRSSGPVKGRIRIYVWDEDYDSSPSVLTWTSDKDKGGYNSPSPTTTLGYNKGSSISIERNAKFFMVQRYGNGNSSQNGRVQIYSKTPRYIDDPWSSALLPGSRWSYNGGRELGHVRRPAQIGNVYKNDDYGKSIAISEGGEKIIIGGPFYNNTGSNTGYITVHTPNSKYTTAEGSATASNYTFTNQEKALFPVQQDNAPRGYLYDDLPNSIYGFGRLRKYEFIYMFNEWEIKGTNDSNYPYTNIIDISGREMDWAVTAVNEYSRDTTNGNELDVSSNVHFWSDSGTLGNYGNGNFINHPDIGAWIPRTPYDPDGDLTELSKKVSTGGAVYKSYNTNENGIFDNSTVYDSSANITVEFDGTTWVEGKTFFKPNSDFTGDYGNASHQFFRTKSVVNLDISGTSNIFDETNGTSKKFEMLYNNDSFTNQYAPSVREEFTDLKNNKYYDYYYHVVNTLCKTDLSGARYPSGSATNSFLTAPGLPSLQYTNASDIELIPASYNGTSTPTLTTEGHGPGTLYDDLRYTFSWYINDWYTNTAYGTTSLGSNAPDAYKSMFGSPDITSATYTGKECNFGRAVAASKDGKIVAVSGRAWDGGATSETGYVEVYQYSTDTLSWSQLGTTIYANIPGWNPGMGGEKTINDGTVEPIINATGFSLDISDDGTILVVGEPYYTTSAGGNIDGTSGDQIGKVRIFKYKTLADGSNDWAKLGEDIIGEGTEGDAKFGSSVAYLEYTDTNTQENKKVVCVGAPYADSEKGYVGLYALALPQGVNTEKTWNVDVQAVSTGGNKFRFTNANNSSEVFGQVTSTTFTALTLDYGSKHIFDYSNAGSHGFDIVNRPINSTASEFLDAGDYEAIKLEKDTNNSKVTVTIKETHNRKTVAQKGYKDRLRGELYYSCTTTGHFSSMQDFATIDNCWSGGNAINNNLDAPQRPGYVGEEFGFSVDIGYDSTDGLIIAVGSPGFNNFNSGGPENGRLDVYRVLTFSSTSKWVPYPETTNVSTVQNSSDFIAIGGTSGQTFGGAEMSGTYNHGGSRLGCSVSLSRDGSTLAVGAEGESFLDGTTNTYAGSVYVLELNTQSNPKDWNEVAASGTTYNFNEAFEVSSANHINYGHYGHSVKIFKDQYGNKTLAVGELGMDDNQSQSGTTSVGTWQNNVYGRVHVYANTGSNWAKLKNTITTASSGDHSRTGDAVTVSQDIVIVGSSFNTQEVVDGELGYVSVWSQDVYLTHLEDVTTTLDTTTNEALNYRWNNHRLNAGISRLSTQSSWSQLGADIRGNDTPENNNARGSQISGTNVALNRGTSNVSGGSILAIGAPRGRDTGGGYPGHVIVYQRDTSNTSAPNGWSKLGATLDDFANGANTTAVALSDDGTIVAIGSPETNTSPNGTGRVKVYEYSSSNNSWTEIGMIPGDNGSDEFGSSVALSSDGHIVAIGALGDNQYTGQAKIYEYSSSNNSWTQKGTNRNGSAMGDEFGTSIALSRNGDIVAIGAPNHNGNDGHVKVYEWDSTNGDWSQLGTDRDGGTDDEFGTSIALSSDGLILAVGAPAASTFPVTSKGLVRVYKWDSNSGANGAWIQVGNDIDGEATGDKFGTSVSLSSDGSIVAIGATDNDAGNSSGDNRGHVRVFEWNGVAWVQISSADIDGKNAGDKSGTAVSLSGDGSIVAIGAPLNADGNFFTNGGLNCGHVRVFEASRPPHGHMSSFDYTPLSIGFNASVSNRKEHHDEWQEGSIVSVTI